jgi:hypothetical protein
MLLELIRVMQKDPFPDLEDVLIDRFQKPEVRYVLIRYPVLMRIELEPEQNFLVWIEASIKEAPF